MKLVLCMTLAASLVLAANKAKVEEPATITPVVVVPVVAPDSKLVQAGDRDIIAINTRVRYTTMIVLPKEERILDFICGDKEFWPVNGSANVALVKPTKADSSTNLHLIAASGNVYSFTLHESAVRAPDIKVFIEPKGDALLGNINASPRFVASETVSDYRHQIEIAQAETTRVRAESQAAIAEALKTQQAELRKKQADLPASLRFDYAYEPQKVFSVSAIYTDGKFTYIKANPQETPALYEIKDDKPSLIQFAYADGLYTAPKVIDRGYLSIGKRKMHFSREK